MAALGREVEGSALGGRWRGLPWEGGGVFCLGREVGVAALGARWRGLPWGGWWGRSALGARLGVYLRQTPRKADPCRRAVPPVRQIPPPPPPGGQTPRKADLLPQEQAVRIVLECILVYDLFLQARGGEHGPLAAPPPPESATVKETSKRIRSL